ncbi:hypothetical protein P43SY_007125 [Pythium insidiosum]|uniref:CBM20 domain-containing protein n=1 Tax=Pythium insidiosum TaxID=114742 RepID=A0AAD5Q7M2_PYTIN|nr:hypothetical protein P43SY_007125 [Pythium insidiosum]
MFVSGGDTARDNSSTSHSSSEDRRPPLHPSNQPPEKRGRASDGHAHMSINTSSDASSVVLAPLSPSPGDVNVGMYTRVHLRVRAETRFGESVHCSGSSLLMGQFNPNESMTLVTTPEEYPFWTTIKPLILPRGVSHQYMYALFSGGVFHSWEPISCERVLIPEGREMVVVEDYGSYDANASLVRQGECSERAVVFERRVPIGGDERSHGGGLSTGHGVDGSSVNASLPRVGSATETRSDSGASDMSGIETGASSRDVDATIDGIPSLSRSSSQHFRLNRLQSRYKRYAPSNYRADPNATLFLVCYHLPVILSKSSETGIWAAQWNRDSLIARTEGSVAESMNVRWVGCVTSQVGGSAEELSEDDKHQISSVLLQMDCIPVFIDRELAADHYQGYCKSKLWPMFHNVDILDIYSSVWDRGEVIEWKEERNNGKWWDAYQKVNELLAMRVAEMCGPKDTVWVHDYHLLLFPSFVASYCKQQDKRRPTMVFFLHVPFPTSEIFRELSHGSQLLEGVLCVDVVGFHSFDHARHFLNACKRFLGLTYQSRRGGNLGVDYRGRNVVITISHVGIEINTIRAALTNPAIHEAARRLREKHAGKILIAGVDTCQRLSGVPLKMLAFEQFFNMCPAWKDKLVLVQKCIITDAREGDQQYSSREIRQLVDRITSQHGGVIDYEELTSTIGLEDRLALWLACDILMVTSVREGLNLKPLEFVFAKSPSAVQDQRPGVVILSEFSACCCVLNGAVRINPWNIAEVVNSLDHALTMSTEERLGRRARDLPYITNQPAANWTKQVLSVLQEATENDDDDEEFTDMEYVDTEIGRSHVVRTGERSDFRQLQISRVVEAYEKSKRRVFLLDYGGTIIARENMSMYVKKDFTAVTGKIPTPRMLDALSLLCSDPRNTVFVVSGVSQYNLTNAVGHIAGLGLAAENGALYSWARSIRSKSVEDANMESFESADSAEAHASGRHWHHQQFKFDWKPVREAVDPILKVYCSRTNGSVLRYLDQAIAWNFRSTDPEWGLLQANSLQNDLEEALRDLPVTIVRKKGLLEIVPEGLNKGAVARQILTQDANINRGHPDFLFCIGDDTTDESMFKAIYDYYAERSEESVHGSRVSALMRSGGVDSPPASSDGSLQHVFTCTVGKKPSHAHLYVNDVDDELRATQDGVIWPRRPVVSAKGLLATLRNLPLSSHDRRATPFRTVAFNATGETFAAADERGRVFVFFVNSNRYSLVQHLGVPNSVH